ncbi:putative DNA helicase II [Candidatus Protochlamydia naegleriophila]|uniref:DNA 3'-5' helicase n=1 Tax=Candidatus Protochlamydia naegleriophila TaxID=389348 RepID=A0A0U5CQN4_9BACT|nr:UvrD-helicase domain-containing protein [Candidatus Protochlamydia naegleriophila]CUI17196.1 putative DNA helicase II [Candidatus Protochlamydia naegleriophila]
MEKQLDLLNPNQKRAAKLVDGRVLILAGAGSGKTRVLTMRMAYLIRNLGVSPKSILGLTFTNKAAAEMRHRLATFVDAQAAKQVMLCTFHSFCMQVLRQDIGRLGYTTKFSLYDEQDVQRLINMIVRDILQHEGELPSLASTLNAIRQAKNKGLAPESIQGTESSWHDSFAQDVYRRLQSSMRAYNAVDFDHLLGLTVELFERFPDVLDRYQERFRYIMIDEYQDTNPIQYRLASLLSAKYHNLCVVGDDDQSIYGWRGADVKNILEFENATLIKLEQNYRSTNVILKAANAVIDHNQQRHRKVLWSDKGEGKPIEVFHTPTEVDEAQAVVKRIVKMKETLGLRWRDFAILYRSNALSRQFELTLMKETWKMGDRWVQGIPYEIFGGVEFYERREVKDLCAYLRLILNPADQEALLRIINQPRRGIGEDSLDVLTAYNRLEQRPLWEVIEEVARREGQAAHLIQHGKALKGIEGFVRIINEAKERFERGNLAENLKWLIEQVDYQKAIKEEVKSQQMRDFKWENVQEFVSSLVEFEQKAQANPEMSGSLEAFIGNLSLDNKLMQSTKDNREEDKVNLLTFHSSKGLEFPVCFLVGMEDHIIPHEKSLKETGLEEERRLMYVAITRAQQHLNISMAKQRKRMGKDMASRPSRFLFEIPKELLHMTDWRVTT